MSNFFKKLVPLRWRLRIRAAIGPSSPPPGFPRTGPRLIVVLAADYPNLGDVALTHALLRLCASNLPLHQTYLLTAGRFFREIRGLARAVSPDDVIVIVGGGNMGDLYPYLEEARLQAVRAFRLNRIISFPQSIYFSDTAGGRAALRRSARVYASHRNLTIFARENASFGAMREAFPRVRVGLAPDTVFTLRPPAASTRDIPLLICLRADVEAKLSADQREALCRKLREAHPAAMIIDTMAPRHGLTYPEYEQELARLLGLFARAKCVVTDRLHGMIFSVVTGTPCVAVENANHKISATVQTWLTKNRCVRLVPASSPGHVLAAMHELAAVPSGSGPDEDEFRVLVAAVSGNTSR